MSYPDPTYFGSGDEPASLLILFAPGAPREAFFVEHDNIYV